MKEHDVAVYLTLRKKRPADADLLVKSFCARVKRRLGNRLVVDPTEPAHREDRSGTSKNDNRGNWDYVVFFKVGGDSAREVDEKVENIIRTVRESMGSSLEIRGVETDK